MPPAGRAWRLGMIHAVLHIDSASGSRRVDLSSYLDAASEEAAHDAEYAWIKQLRHARVDGRSFRERFTVRGDSLWWFTEIYLHKMQAILDVHRVILATETLIARERPTRITIEEAPPAVRDVVPQAAAVRGVATASARIPEREWRARLARIKWRARMLTLAARASRLKTSSDPGGAAPAVAAFVHRAFWRSGQDDGSAESYIGPVLAEIERASGGEGVRYVGVGPASNFRVRRWWHPLAPTPGERAVAPVERFAPWRALRESEGVWRRRRRDFSLLARSEDLRAAATIRGIDCWPIVREQLAGVVWLQWPWSARAMDEAGAALDALRPRAVVTYAEAGGWGRALVLEARRRSIPSIGLQHGFIYSRWLNYLHEPDEMQPASNEDRGFPAPTMTLAFDEYAARHLRERGHFPPGAVRVTGSPKLDALLTSLRATSAEDNATTRRAVGARDTDAIVLLTTKESQVRGALPGLVAAAAAIPNALLVIKPHPGESERAYDAVVAGNPRARVVGSATSLAALLAIARAVVTVNSTVALDAGVADIPALVIGLPNNLSPFVEAGALAGAAIADIRPQLERILYDQEFRQQLERARRVFLEQSGMRSDGRAAVRAAEAVLEIVRRQCAC